MTGTALAQLIPLLIAPVLSRIYSPTEFGRLALYLSIVQILGSAANGRYELAIVLPKERKEGVQLTLISILITVGVSFFSLLGVLLFSEEISRFLGDPKLSSWLFLVPVSVLMIGAFNALNYYNTREKKFRDIAKANIFKSFGGNLTQLLLGLAKYTAGGLIIGQVLSHFFGNIRMLKSFLKEKNHIRETQWEDLKYLAKRYVNFPKFSLGAIFFNTVSVNLSNFFISRVYTLSSVGFYSHAYRYLAVPLNLIGNSVSQVYFQKLSENKEDREVSLSFFYKSLKRLCVLGLVFFVPLFFVIEELYVFIFGEEWRMAGHYARILIPLFYIRLTVSPLSVTNSVFEHQKISFLWQLGLLLINVGIFVAAMLLNWSLISLLVVMVVCLSVYYLYLLWIMRNVIIGKYG